MSRRDAAFARGEIGVDGSATEEKKEKAEVERGKARDSFLRGKTWLGRELLTWLLFRSESSEPIGEITVLLVDRLVLKAIDGEVMDCTVKGAMAPYSRLVKQALSSGLLVQQARLRLEKNERVFEVTLDAEFFDCKSGKLPDPAAEEDDDRLRERLENAGELGALVEGLLEQFLKVRTSASWSRKIVPELKAWMSAA